MQHIASVQTPRARQAIIDTFLMQNRDWPVGLILSGMPGVKKMTNADPQLGRRIFPVEIIPISWAMNGGMIRSLLTSYAGEAGLQASGDLCRDNFIARLVHSGASQFGLIVEMVIAAIEEALHDQATVLEHRHFTIAFRRRTGCIDGLNLFLSEDYLAIDPRRLLGGAPDDPDPSR